MTHSPPPPPPPRLGGQVNAPPGSAASARPARRGCRSFLLTGGLGLALAASLLLNLLLLGLAAGSLDLGRTGGQDEYPDLTETWSYGPRRADAKVARIAVEGVILPGRRGGLFGPSIDPVEHVLQQIRTAMNDRRVKAIVLEVDSPGGGVTASDEIYRQLQEFRASAPGRKVVVLTGDLAASGGYYVAMASDYIVAQPTSIVGSIGVLIQTLNLEGLGEKLGVSDVTIKSGENKDLLNPFQAVDEEHRAILQNLVDAMHRRFLDLVRDTRHLGEEALGPLADGRILPADKALEAGLVDAVGYWDDALAKVRELVGEPEVKVVRYERVFGLADLLGVRTAPPPLAARLGWALSPDTPRLMYLWQP